MITPTGPLSVRVGGSAAAACSGSFDPFSNPPRGRWLLPAGGVTSTPAFYCLEYTNLGPATETLHRVGVEGIDDADLPFATTRNASVAPGGSMTLVVGPISAADGQLRWVWTPYSADGAGAAATADTSIEVAPFDGDVVVQASIFGGEPVSCDGSEATSLVVPYNDGPGTPGFSVWYCLTATNTGTVVAPAGELVLGAGSLGERTVAVSGGLLPGQARTIVVGPVFDHPEGTDGISPRTLAWIATGPGLVPGVDDQSIAEGVATVEVIRSSIGAPVVEIDAEPLLEPSFVPSTVGSVTIRRGPAAPAELDILVQTRAPSEVVGFVATPGTACGDGVVDYVAITGLARTLTAAAPSEVVDITICGDIEDEPFESLAIDVFERRADGSAGELLATRGVQFIDDDQPLAVNPVDVELTEPDFGDETVAVSFPLSRPAGRDHHLVAFYDGDLQVSFNCGFNNGIGFGADPVLGDFVPDFELAAGAQELTFEDRGVRGSHRRARSIGHDHAGRLRPPLAGLDAPTVAEFVVTVLDEDTFPVLVGVDNEDWEDSGDGNGDAVVYFDVVTAPEIPWLFDATYASGFVGDTRPGILGPCLADLGFDFEGGWPQVTVFPDSTRIAVTVHSCPDGVIETDYAAAVELRATGAFTTEQEIPASAVVIVHDDDTPPQVPLITEILVDEGSGGGLTSVPVSIPILADAHSPEYRVRLGVDPFSGDATVGFCDGPFVDLEFPNPVLPHIFQGDASIEFDIDVCADDVDEPDRTAWIHITDQVPREDHCDGQADDP